MSEILREDELIVLAEELYAAGHSSWLIEGEKDGDAEASLEMLNAFILGMRIKGYSIVRNSE